MSLLARRSLLAKYGAAFLGVVGIPLVGFSAGNVWLAYTEHRAALVALQRTNAEAAAVQIARFVGEIESQLR